VPSSISRPRSTEVSGGPASAGGAGGGGGGGRNVCVKVIATGTGAPPKRPGAKRNARAAAMTASSNGGCGGVTRSALCTAPVTSTSSLTVTMTGPGGAGAPAG